MNITHVGPTLDTFNNLGTGHSPSGRMHALAMASNGTRVYAGSYAGVWRSDDGGSTWQQLRRPQPLSLDADVPGALFSPAVFSLAVSPEDPDLVLASAARGPYVTSRDGIYRSTDGGESWTRVHAVDPAVWVDGAPGEFVSQIVFAPDDPTLVYAAVGSAVAVSRNAGATWTRHVTPAGVWHVAPAARTGNQRRVYAAGGGRMYRSTNGGTTWLQDLGATAITASFGATGDGGGSGGSVIVVDPSNSNCVFLAGVGKANGPSFFAPSAPDGTRCNTTPQRGCGEGSLWYGDYTQFGSAQMAQWTQLPGPPVYWGVTSPSGNSFIVAQKMPGGFLLFFADESHVHVCAGKPASTGAWHRLDGKDVSVVKAENDLHNRIFVHPDPHALAVTPDFEITLLPATGVPPPYDQNSVLDQHVGGTILMANDGGVYRSDDGGANWSDPARGLETVDPINIAGIAGIGGAPALYMGCGDNDDFFTVDGGQIWGDPSSYCGDCDAWFADIADPSRVLQFDPRGPGLRVRNGNGGAYPNAASDAFSHNLAAPRGSNASSGPVIRGFRPIVRTLATELPPSDGDYVFIGMKPDNTVILIRTTAISSISTVDDWDDPSKAQQVGPPLPPGVDVVQAAGGHTNTVFYVQNTAAAQLFRLDGGTQWTPIVPGGAPGQTASSAWRFYVNPFMANVVYILDDNAVRVSLDFGASWQIDPSLTWAVTAGQRMTLNPSTAMNDMLFVRSDPFTAFVFGHAGVSYTYSGADWRPLLSAIAQPGCPEFGFFDGITDPNARALYVSFTGRSVQRLDPILPRPQETPQSFTLMELAAMLES
jgi:photosystem II stability/assembly factor-like uncharacterized protein